MKKIACAVISTVMLGLPSVNAAGFSQDFIEGVLIQACKDVKSNSIIKLKTNLKKNHLSTKLISEKLMCNGESVYQFALTHNADKTARILRTGSVMIQDMAFNADDKYWVWLD